MGTSNHIRPDIDIDIKYFNIALLSGNIWVWSESFIRETNTCLTFCNFLSIYLETEIFAAHCNRLPTLRKMCTATIAVPLTCFAHQYTYCGSAFCPTWPYFNSHISFVEVFFFMFSKNIFYIVVYILLKR